ncbi:MAG: T9SS type A sorting domain-containing protein [bacterium]|nr:T9SS type A sorting domain-containing protein [bacterium]
MERRIIIILLAILILNGIGIAQDSSFVRKVGEIANWSWAYNVVISGDYAYVATHQTGLRIVNISNPAQPIEVGYSDTPGYSYSVAVSGTYAYVADGFQGLRVIDVSNPYAPVEQGHLAMPYDANDVAVQGSFVYIADNEGGLRIVNVSNPSAPVEVATCSVLDVALGVTVLGSYAYVAADYSGLAIVDISNPVSPLMVGQFQGEGESRGVAVAGNYAYLAAVSHGLTIVDVTDPLNPHEMGHVLTGSSRDVVVSGSYAYIANWACMKIVNVANPRHPFVVGSCPPGPGGATFGVAVCDSIAYMANYDNGLYIADVTDPSAPNLLGTYSANGYASNVVISSPYAYIADGNYGLRIVDVSNPALPFIVSRCSSMPGQCRNVAISGNYVYTVNTTSMRVIDVSNPALPINVGSCTTSYSYGVAAVGTMVYVADYYTGVRIIDASRPSAPTQVGLFSYPVGSTYDVDISGQYAYIARRTGGMRVLDISNPTAPIEVGYCSTPGEAQAIALSGNYAYIACGQGGLAVANISVPEAPLLMGTIDTPGDAQGVAVSGMCAYVADFFSGGLRLIDVSNPASLREIGYYYTPGNACGVAALDSLAYVADETYFGIYQYTYPLPLDINILPINAPIVLPANGGTFWYYINVHNLTLQSQTAAIWNKVRDVSNNYYTVFGPITRLFPSQANWARIKPQTIAGTIPSGTLSFISYVGTYPNVIQDSSFFTITKSAVTDGGPWVSESGCFSDFPDEVPVSETPNKPILLGISPNPFNPTTTLSFELPAASFVTLSVYDISGRKVVDLVNGKRDAGSQEVTFDGLTLASGVYLYKLEASDPVTGTGTTTICGKIVLMK